MVYLVGAGPGDENLITVKGTEILKIADVLIYDALVSKEILRLVNPLAKLIYVGKIGGNHAVLQDEINEIILKEGMLNQVVVRLKGGDSFLFGRGGEELELLHKYSISYEIIPGITSPLAVPAYAGIPVTHRDFVSSLHIVTGHTKESEGSKIDFDSLVKLNGTIVFLMGIGSLSLICDGLKKAKMPLDMPCAIIENGTRQNQKTLISTLENLQNDAKTKNVKSPAIIMFGKVCSLHEKFDWFNPSKKRVLVTRPLDLESKLSKKLILSGFDVFDIPTTKISEIDFTLDENMLKSASVLAFTSANGVKIFFKKLIENRIDIRKLSHLKFAAVGKMTASEIEKNGILVDILPETFSGEHLAKEIFTDGTVLIFRALEPAFGLSEGLLEKNIHFVDIPVYQTNILTIPKAYENDLKDSLDAICFTSASSVKGFVNSIQIENFKDTLAICIGEMTKNQAKLCGFTNILVSKEATTDSMILLLKEVLQ